MDIKELYNFMVENKILEAKHGDIELKIHPDALVKEMSPVEREKWEKDIQEQNKEVEKFDKVDPRFWSA